VIKDVRAGAFRALLRFLYTHGLPKKEDCGEGLEVEEMARMADRFQAVALYKHCVPQFREGLKVGNVVVRLAQAHDGGLAALEEAGMGYFKANAIAFGVRLASRSGLVNHMCVLVCVFVHACMCMCE